MVRKPVTSGGATAPESAAESEPPSGSPVFADGEPGSLTNHLLIAMPRLTDPNFAQTVTLICEHSDKGALGIVLNKPLPMKLADVLSQMKLEPSTELIGEQPVLRGGPVHTDRGFVLHRPGGEWDSTHKVSDSIQVTTSRDVLAAMARGEGPRMPSSRSATPAGTRASSSARCRTTPGSRCRSTTRWCSSCPSRSAGRPPGSCWASTSTA